MTLTGTATADSAPRRAPAERGWRALAAALAQGTRWGLSALVAAVAVAVVILPALTGSITLTVLTGSMRATLPPGTLVVVKPVSSDSIGLGDVVTYQLHPGRPEVVTHRVVAVRLLADGSRQFITKGDSNAVPDPAPVQAAQVKGIVWYSLPVIGALGLALGEHRPLLLAFTGVGLLAYAALLLGSVVRARLRRRLRLRETRGRESDDRAPRHPGGAVDARPLGRAPRADHRSPTRRWSGPARAARRAADIRPGVPPDRSGSAR